MFNIIRSDYLASAVRKDQYPEETKILPEIAFIGRSNVGKSSLINSLLNRKNLARVSSTPGKTQTINFYKVTAKVDEEKREEFLLVDLPGYGYAKRMKSSRKQWSDFTEEYWLNATNLKLVCHLVDMRHEPMESDVNVYRWFKAHNLPVLVIGTKSDKVAKNHLQKHLSQMIKILGEDSPDLRVIAYSSVKKTGTEQLLDAIRTVLLK
ncbi:ribosome biogenesis GTP-binding protein YihA/YsxC [Selenomonadales bacterium OttesenSCG-928-I06]|nr:ribosome biogenesis GTP-binding protein YihA/YsxC [Selenomonadales bacterium OttesenSCG-928-I06]